MTLNYSCPIMSCFGQSALVQIISLDMVVFRLRRDALADTLSVTDDDLVVSCTTVVNGCKLLIVCCYNSTSNSGYRVALE